MFTEVLFFSNRSKTGQQQKKEQSIKKKKKKQTSEEPSSVMTIPQRRSDCSVTSEISQCGD